MIRGAMGAAVAVTALVVYGLATGCTSDLGGTDDVGGSDVSETAAESAEPGRYSALPEPCGSVDEERLRELLPGAGPEAYEGHPVATYDTGRRVGCEWDSRSDAAASHLSIDFERVISYDPEVSDDDQAERDFEELAAAAGVPLDGGTATMDYDGQTPVATTLDDVGHAAYLIDEPATQATGDGREVTIAFRNANVIATVTYRVSATTEEAAATDGARLPDLTHAVAQQLAEDLDG